MMKSAIARAWLVAGIAYACSSVMAPSALAGDIKGVVELFTSEGCSSCPPADAVLSRLVEQGGVLALAYHVDYWNYLGWKDTFSDKKYTERQYGYARSFDRNSVYTPQMVINGRAQAVGSDETAIRGAVARLSASDKGLTIPLSARISDGGVAVSFGAGAGTADILLVTYAKKSPVLISRGENNGRTIVYRNTVLDIHAVGMWRGDAMTTVLPMSSLHRSTNSGAAVLLQRTGRNGEPDAILGALVLPEK